MARFDVYRNPGRHKDSVPYLLDVQSDYLNGLASRVVIPLRRRAAFAEVKLPLDLTPVFIINGIECFLDTPGLAAVPCKELGRALSSLAQDQSHIVNAMGRLFGAF